MSNEKGKDNIEAQNSNKDKSFPEKKNVPEDQDLNVLRKNHIKELKRRKKMLAKDDFG